MKPDNIDDHAVIELDSVDDPGDSNAQKRKRSAFDTFGEYMNEKIRKLDDQLHSVKQQSHILAGVSVYVTGNTNPPYIELRELVTQNGGRFQQYFSRSVVTHVIAANLSVSRARDLHNDKVVKPEWIVDSLAHGSLLPWKNYALLEHHKVLGIQVPSINSSHAVVKSNSPDFVKSFYGSSRLHHLSTWKAELQKFTFRSGSGGSIKQNRVIMHVDMDCYFASVALRDRPEYAESPVGVSHGQGQGGMKSSDVASCNYIARSFGIRNGMSIGRAKQLCPELIVLPYDFEKYRESTAQIYEIFLHSGADALEPVSCDEAYLDVSSAVSVSLDATDVNCKIDPSSRKHNTAESSLTPVEFAMKIIAQIKESTGLPASIGVGGNPLQARIATKLAKPSGIYYMKGDAHIRKEIDKLAFDSLPGIGHSLRDKVASAMKSSRDVPNIDDSDEAESDTKHEITCQQVRTSFKSVQALQKVLGNKVGETTWNHLQGHDKRIIAESGSKPQRQSVSAEVNWGIRFTNKDDTENFLKSLWKEVTGRLLSIHADGAKSIPKKMGINIGFRHTEAPHENTYKYLGCGWCERVSRTVRCPSFDQLSSYQEISALFWKICNEFNNQRYPQQRDDLTLIIKDLRGIGIGFTDLSTSEAKSDPVTYPSLRKHVTGSALVSTPGKRQASVFEKLDYGKNSPNPAEIEKQILMKQNRKHRIQDLVYLEAPEPSVLTNEFEMNRIRQLSADDLLNELLEMVERYDFRKYLDLKRTFTRHQSSTAVAEIFQIVDDCISAKFRF